MLQLPSDLEKPNFQRNATDNSCTWFGQPCRILSSINEGVSLASTCFVHEAVSGPALAQYAAGRNLAELFTAKMLPSMDEFRTHFLCVGLYQGEELVGLWDMPLGWLEGAKLLPSRLLVDTDYQQLKCAAQEKALAHPVEMTPKPTVTAGDDDNAEDGEDEISAAEAVVAAGRPPAVCLDGALPNHENHVELSLDDLAEAEEPALEVKVPEIAVPVPAPDPQPAKAQGKVISKPQGTKNIQSSSKDDELIFQTLTIIDLE